MAGFAVGIAPEIDGADACVLRPLRSQGANESRALHMSGSRPIGEICGKQAASETMCDEPLSSHPFQLRFPAPSANAAAPAVTRKPDGRWLQRNDRAPNGAASVLGGAASNREGCQCRSYGDSPGWKASGYNKPHA